MRFTCVCGSNMSRYVILLPPDGRYEACRLKCYFLYLLYEECMPPMARDRHFRSIYSASHRVHKLLSNQYRTMGYSTLFRKAHINYEILYSFDKTTMNMSFMVCLLVDSACYLYMYGYWVICRNFRKFTGRRFYDNITDCQQRYVSYVKHIDCTYA